MGYRKLSARPRHHAQGAEAVDRFKKRPRRWARRSSEPSAPRDQRTRSASIFGAICPRPGKAAARVMPWCDTHAMNQRLIGISRDLADNAHAVLIMDQAGLACVGKAHRGRALLPRMAKAPEPAIENHVHRHAGLGA
ncbi:hypothetical protein BLJAPNOD_03551 [Ensifer sp. M14]|nr:hypothetical protein BLJAPNOD_03551 [Ensifer sp. M14]